jgi:hypothetical protein
VRLWRGESPSEGTKRNRRIRGSGTWGEQVRNLNTVEQKELRQRRGSGSWGSESKNLYRLERRRMREERRNRSMLARLLG